MSSVQARTVVSDSGLPVRSGFCDYMSAVALAVLLLASPVAARAGQDAWQYSTIAALMAGGYDGELAVTAQAPWRT